jgi:hypothetical protein
MSVWCIAERPSTSTELKTAGGTGEATMELHAPSIWVFIVSFIIVLIAVISVFTPIPYISAYGFWVAILA